MRRAYAASADNIPPYPLDGERSELVEGSEQPLPLWPLASGM